LKAIVSSWLTPVVCLIIGKVLVVLHVVNIYPLSVKRNLIFKITIKGGLHIFKFPVAPFTLMPSKGPLGRQYWGSN
jgi:hypothetical protein